MSYMELSIYHHGILGQKWGVRNGPPYPLGGGKYTRTEQVKIQKARKDKYSRYNKKHYDEVLAKGTKLRTLSFNKDRTADTDMFFAAHTRTDIDHYKSFFDLPAQQPIYDSDGNEIGTGMFRKYSIQNELREDVKVASEDSGAKAFRHLYETDRDFYNYVTDPNRLRARFEDGVHRVTPGYERARVVMDKMRVDPNYIPTDKDLTLVYRIFNHAIPSDGGGDARAAHDVVVQRTKFFNELKKNGYGAVLDTNDALYNAVQAQSPVIMFDMEAMIPAGAYRTTTAEVMGSRAVDAARYLLGRR